MSTRTFPIIYDTRRPHEKEHRSHHALAGLEPGAIVVALAAMLTGTTSAEAQYFYGNHPYNNYGSPYAPYGGGWSNAGMSPYWNGSAGRYGNANWGSLDNDYYDDYDEARAFGPYRAGPAGLGMTNPYGGAWGYGPTGWGNGLGAWGYGAGRPGYGYYSNDWHNGADFDDWYEGRRLED